jgi:hypothetical protein
LSTAARMSVDKTATEVERAFDDKPDTVNDKYAHEETLNQMKQEVTHANVDEKKLLLKTDLHVVPILFLLFLCAFIDR